MKKKSRKEIVRRQQSLERKEYKQRRSHNRRLQNWKLRSLSKIQPSIQIWKDTRSVSLLYKTLSSSEELKRSTIKVPRQFTFHDSHDECVEFFTMLTSSLYHHIKELCIDFSVCEKVSVSTISLLYILIRDYRVSLGHGKKKARTTKFSIIPPAKPGDLKVLKYLKIFDLYDYRDFKTEDGEFLKLPVLSGKFRGSFTENRKAKAAREIVDFINDSYRPARKILSKDGRNLLEGLTTEMLNNAEDHSIKKETWYVSGVTFHDSKKDADLLELNLTILNFGDSFYEGFEKTKLMNSENYQKLEKLLDHHKKQFTWNQKFERESLFTLYMLNEGISRLKYEDESRGNGTMQFLKAFSDLEDKGPQDKNYRSVLKIITGHTTLSCDSDVVPYGEDREHLHISLNKEQDFKKLPDVKYLQYHPSYFPGSFIECRVFLNKNLIEQKNG